MQLYPQSSHDAFHGVNVQFPPEVDQAVQQIYGACKGFGTDEKTLIAVLGSKSPEMRTLIAMRYQQLYSKPLKDLMKSETSGDFGRLLRMISTPLHETEAQLLRDATKGMGTTESILAQILSGRTNEEMDILKKTYFKMFNKDLAVTVSSELSGDFKKVIMAMLQSQQLPFNPAFHTAAKAEEDAVKIYKAGQGRMGTNEEVFIGAIVVCPPEYLKMVDAVYVQKYNNNLAKAVDKEFSGDAKKSLNYLVKSVMDPFTTIAEAFEKTMKGFGTDETGLSTALVRYHCVLPQVKEAYKRMYRKELRDRIYGETSGDYRKLLLEIYDAPQDVPVSKASKTAAATTGAADPAASMPHPAPGQPGAPGYGAAPPAPSYGVPAGQPPHGHAPGYPPQAQTPAQPGYPGAQPQVGYPAYQPPQPGYPAPQQQGSYPTQQPGGPYYQQQPQQPGYPPQQPGNAPQQPQAQPGYPGAQPQVGYPAYQTPQPGYPVPQQQGSYPTQQQPGYPQYQQQPPAGQPPQQPGYPPQQPQPGYPPQQQQQAPYGYPPQQQQQPGAPGYPPQGAYPPQQQAPGYPPQQAAPGYPPQQQPGYPPQQAAPGYPPQQAAPGYPPQQAAPGYPPQQAAPGYPPQQYPPQQGYPPQGQYPPQQGGYPGYQQPHGY